MLFNAMKTFFQNVSFSVDFLLRPINTHRHIPLLFYKCKNYYKGALGRVQTPPGVSTTATDVMLD